MRHAIVFAVLMLLVSPRPALAGPEAGEFCGTDLLLAKTPLATTNPYPGIVPGRGLSEEDFADGGLLIEVDPSMYQVTDDPIGVITRAARHWEIPGTMIKFRVGGAGVGGNIVRAEPLRQQAYATVGRPGLGARGKLLIRVNVPFRDGDERLVSILAHEIGHWLGFDHSFLMETVMSPILNDQINWIDPDQVAKAVLRYGTGQHAVGTVHGRVTRRGVGISGARINLLGEEERTAFGTFAASDGSFTLPVYAGSYRLFVDPNDGPAVAKNFIGIYPGGPLDFITHEVAEPVVVSAGEATAVEVAVPEGDHAFRVTTIEPRTVSPGSSVQRVRIYYAGADPEEIASVEPLTPDIRITSQEIVGQLITIFFDVDTAAPAGPRAFILRKTNGALAVVPGTVGVVVPLRLVAPHYTLEAEAGEPVRIEWQTVGSTRGTASYRLSASIDGGRTWEVIGHAPAEASSFDWIPRGVTASALRVRVEALATDGRTTAMDQSMFNVGLGRPAAATPVAGTDVEAPAVTLLSPNGGEVRAVGDLLRVEWEAFDDVGIAEQVVELSADGGRSWGYAAALGPIARFLDIPTDQQMRGDVVVRVRARDGAGHEGSDTSDGPFLLRDRPTIDRVVARTKGAGYAVRIQGGGLGPEAVVRINGEVVSGTLRFNAARGRLIVKGDAAALHLNGVGQTNRLVVEVSGLVSAEAVFTTEGP